MKPQVTGTWYTSYLRVFETLNKVFKKSKDYRTAVDRTLVIHDSEVLEHSMKGHGYEYRVFLTDDNVDYQHRIRQAALWCEQNEIDFLMAIGNFTPNENRELVSNVLDKEPYFRGNDKSQCYFCFRDKESALLFQIVMS